MRILIVTVAGMSSRFSESIGRDTIKCLYSDSGIERSLLFTLLNQSKEFDKYVVVGGYRYSDLAKTIDDEFGVYRDKLILVENKHFQDYGSGYSLFLGLQKALEFNADEIVFAEGDLFLDEENYSLLCKSERSVISINTEPIYANKAVALYMDEKETIHYIYDTGHKALTISEPFVGIFNSGQVWKFGDCKLVKEVLDKISAKEWQGTNLIFVEKYFATEKRENIEIITFKKWINCNTISDFRKI